MNFATYQDYLDHRNVMLKEERAKAASNNEPIPLTPSPFSLHPTYMFDAQLAYTVNTSEWRQLKAVKDIVYRHGTTEVVNRFTAREEVLRNAHVLELQAIYKLNVVGSTVGMAAAYPISEALNKKLQDGYYSGLDGDAYKHHEYGLLANVGRYRCLNEHTEAVCSIVTLAASKLSELSREYVLVIKMVEPPEDRLDYLYKHLSMWSYLITLAPDEYPVIGMYIRDNIIPDEMGEVIFDYLKRSVPLFYRAFTMALDE
jgi:hypothetical protein